MPETCLNCGAEYPSAKGFRRQPGRKNRHRLDCPGCAGRRREAIAIFSLKLFISFTLLGTVLRAVLHEGPGGGILFAGEFYLMLGLCIVPHELAHAAAAVILGMRLFVVNIGTGRPQYAYRLSDSYVIVGRIQLNGSVVLGLNSTRFARTIFCFVTFCGPLANALLALLAWRLIEGHSDREAVYWWLAALLWSNFVLLVLSLIPFRLPRKQRRTRSDGLQFVLTLFRSRKSIEQWHATTMMMEAMEAAQRNKPVDAERWLITGEETYPNNLYCQFGRAQLLLRQRMYSQARSLSVSLLDHSDATLEWKTLLWNNIAWTDLMLDDPALLQEADNFSRQALEENPWAANIAGTRGSVLIDLGRIEAGIPLVARSLWENSQPLNQALNLCYLAIAASRQGNAANASAFIARAKTLDPNCPLLERAIRAGKPAPPVTDTALAAIEEA